MISQLLLALVYASRICGQLDDGVLTEANGHQVDVIYGIGMTADEHLQAVDEINARWVGNQVCISGELSGTDLLFVDRLEKISRDLDAPPIENMEAERCMLFVDRVAPVFTYHEFSPNGSYSTLDLRFYLKVAPDLLDASIKAVRFYGRDRYSNAPDFHFPPISGTSWLGATDYFEFRGMAPHGVSRLGAFYVETTAGTRYWFNADEAPFHDFVIDATLAQNVMNAFGVYGQVLPPPDGLVRPAPLERPLDVGTLPTSADVFPYLNPAGCR